MGDLTREKLSAAWLIDRGLMDLCADIAQRHHVTVDDMLGSAHIQSFVRARHEFWKVLYVDLKKSVREISIGLDVDRSTIMSAFKYAGVKPRPKHGARSAA